MVREPIWVTTATSRDAVWHECVALVKNCGYPKMISHAADSADILSAVVVKTENQV